MAKKGAKFCVLDTNVLVYALNADSERHADVQTVLSKLLKQGYRFCITEQIVRETLVVMTQPRLTAHPLSPHQARLVGQHLLFRFVFLPSNHASRLHLLELLEQYDVRGNAIHDTNIVAIMKAHGVRDLLTFNRKDFRYYADVTLL